MAIPDNAKKVFEGIIFDVYHWEQEQFDGTFKTFEKLKHCDSVVVIPIVGDKIFIQKEEQPGQPAEFSLPAGRFERDETDPIEVGLRELMEETGYHSDNVSLFRSQERGQGQLIDWTCHIVIARNCQKTGEPDLDPGERIHETRLLSFDELIEFSERPDFFGGVLAEDLKTAKTDPAFREDFRKKIFSV